MQTSRFTRPLSILLLLCCLLQACATPIFAAEDPPMTRSEDPRSGLISDYGLTMAEVAADCYLSSKSCRGDLARLKDISNWPSEKLLESAKEANLKFSLGLDKAVHALTDPSVLVGKEKEIKDNYRTILICILLEESQRYENEALDEFQVTMESGHGIFKKLLELSETNREIGQLTSKEKEELKKTVKEGLAEELDIALPLDEILDKFFLVANTVEDFIELCQNLTALCGATEEDKALVDELAAETNDALLKTALLEISASMDSLPLAVADAFVDSAANAGMEAGKMVLSEAYKQTVLSALPKELSLALQAGTKAGDIVVSLMFSNDDMADNLLMLECVGALGRDFISTSDRLEKRYLEDKSGFDMEKIKTDAGLYVRSIEALYTLRKLSCDYSEAFADSAMDATTVEKIIRVFDNEKDASYKDFLDKLATDKQNVLQDELSMNLAPLYDLWGLYPDEYAVRKIDGLSVEDFISKLQDDYQKEIDAVPNDYAPDGMTDIRDYKKKSGGSSSKKTETDKTDQTTAGQDKKQPASETSDKSTGKSSDNSSADSSDQSSANSSNQSSAGTNSEESSLAGSPFDDFLNDKTPAYVWNDEPIYYSDLTSSDNGFPYEAGPQLDLDNDGENELILTGMYGGMILDARNGKISVLTEGMGTAGVLCYGYYEGKYVICHKDTSHAGRQEYRFTVYEGGDMVVESFSLTADYWDAPDPNRYSEDSTFKFKGQEISMQEYERLLGEIFG